MPARRRLGALLFLVCAAGGVRAAESANKFIVVDEFLLADPHPDSHFSDAGLATRFKTAFSAAFPSQVLQLGPGRLLRQEEPAVVLVPRISAARVSHEEVSGLIQEYRASVVGSVDAVDPWTNAVLFSARHTVLERVRLGNSKVAATDADLRAAFEAGFDNWMQLCFADLKKLGVFRLSAPTLAIPAEAAKGPGGAWPFGWEHGLRSGLMLTGAGGHAARVNLAGDRYSGIVDAADGARPIPPGETYSLTVAEEPGASRKPRVSVSWLGPPPDVPNGANAAPLSVDAAIALFINDANKDSSFQLLAPPIEDAAQQAKYERVLGDVSRYTGLVAQELMTIHQGALVQMAKENPDFRIVLFSAGSYFGTSQEKNAIEHRYRATLGAALLARHGDEDAPEYAVVRVFLRDGHLGRMAEAGIRQRDDGDAVFTAWLRALSQLSGDVLASGVLTTAGTPTMVEAEVGAGRTPVWPAGMSPETHAPLLWLRPAGTIDLGKNDSAHPYYRLEIPSLGYLTRAVVSTEKLKTGDKLRYTRVGKRAEVLGLRFELAPKDTAALLDPAVLQALVAGRFAETLDREIVTTDAAGHLPSALEGTPILRCYVSSLAETENTGGLAYTGQWRLQLLPTAGQPAVAKLGLEVTSQVAAAEAARIQPLDQLAYRLQYLAKSLDELASGLRTEGFDRALTTLNVSH